MKDVTSSMIFLIILCSHVLLSGQDVLLDSQEAVDSFDPSTTVINGDLTLFGAGIDSLHTLRNLQSIEGSLYIDALNGLNKIDELENIRVVGGHLHVTNCGLLISIEGLRNIEVVDDLVIEDTQFLRSLKGLQGLERIEGELHIEGNRRLRNVDSLANVESVGSVKIWYNDELQDIDGLSNIRNVDGDISLLRNEELGSIDGFVGLTQINGNLRIDSSPITLLSGLHNITRVEGDLLTYNCDDLVNLDALSNLTHVGGDLTIENHAELTSVAGLSNIEFLGGDLDFTSNHSLEVIDFDYKMNVVNGDLTIRDNRNLQHIDWLLSVDTIYGNFRLGSGLLIFLDQTDFDGAANLKAIYGDLMFENFDELTSLQAFSNLEIIEGGLSLRWVLKLESIDFVENITSLEYIHIARCDKLVDINGLENIESVSGDITIVINQSLEECCAIQPLLFSKEIHIGGGVEIRDNATGCRDEQEISYQDCGHIEGAVYYDQNENKQKDQDEFWMPGIRLTVNGEEDRGITNEEGKFLFDSEQGEIYSFSPQLADEFLITTDSASYTVYYDPTSIEQYEFGLVHASEYRSCDLSITSYETRCNTEVEFFISVLNDGSLKSDGTIKLTLDPQVSYVSSSFPVVFVTGQYIIAVDSLEPFERRTYTMVLDMPSEQFTGEVISFAGEVYYGAELMDEEVYSATVLCSYDPNDKQVSPVGYKEEGYTLISDELNYTVRFQNTGNAAAIDVRIIDTLSEHLDLRTFKVNQSSFPVITTMRGNIVDFYFEDIFLIDSMTNEPESHGFINYTIKPKGDIGELTEIKNTAHIVFDFNPPIVTNTTNNTMVETICFDQIYTEEASICEGEDYLGFTQPGSYELAYPAGVTCDSIIALELTVLPLSDPQCVVNTDDLGRDQFRIYPNPATDHIYIESDLTPQIEIFSLQGQLLFRTVSSDFDVTLLPQGVYMVRVSSGVESEVHRVVKL